MQSVKWTNRCSFWYHQQTTCVVSWSVISRSSEANDAGIRQRGRLVSDCTSSTLLNIVYGFRNCGGQRCFTQEDQAISEVPGACSLCSAMGCNSLWANGHTYLPGFLRHAIARVRTPCAGKPKKNFVSLRYH